MTRETTEKINRIILLALIAGMVCYVIIRAFLLSFTHDECLTFGIISGDKTMEKTANHHFLNTWLAGFFYHIFGMHEFVLRLPNVLGFLIYTFFCYKILLKSPHILLTLAGASLLFLNPYLVDFFSLCRGYGLSVAFATGALYFLMRNRHPFTYEQFKNNLSWSLAFSLLAAYSNFVLINLNLALLVVFGIELISALQKGQLVLSLRQKRLLILIVLVNFIILYIPVERLLHLGRDGQLYVGGRSGFIEDTVSILVEKSLYLISKESGLWLRIRQLVILIFTITFLYQLYAKRFTRLSKITSILFLLIFASILQHYLFDALYLIMRTSIIFIPVFGLTVYLLLTEVFELMPSRRFLNYGFYGLLVLISLPLMFHFYRSINLKFCLEWKNDADTKSAMKKVVQEIEKSGETGKILISNEWFFEPSINYYLLRYNINANPVNRDGINLAANYIYCSKAEWTRLNIGDTSGYKVIHYPISESVLLIKE